MARPQLPEGKKRVSITVTTESWDKVQALAKEAGLSRNWLSSQIDSVLPHIAAVVESARVRQKMTAKEAMHDLVDRLTADPRVRD